eukprot:5055867-Prymnesium_polylepis.1
MYDAPGGGVGRYARPAVPLSVTRYVSMRGRGGFVAYGPAWQSSWGFVDCFVLSSMKTRRLFQRGPRQTQ